MSSAHESPLPIFVCRHRLIFYGDGSQYEFDFEASPGADVSRIVLSVDGATVREHGEDLT